MVDAGRRLFIGIKISPQLQNDLESPAPGTERYFKSDNGDYLEIINMGEEKLIGRYVKDGFPVAELDNVSRNICSIVKLITRGRPIDDNAVHIYLSQSS